MDGGTCNQCWTSFSTVDMDPCVRRKTAPTKLTSKPKLPLSLFTDVKEVRPSAHVLKEGQGRVQDDDGEFEEIPLLVRKKEGLTMLEFKGSCHFDVQRALGMEYKTNLINGIGEPWKALGPGVGVGGREET